MSTGALIVSRHSLGTRTAHASLAVTIIGQLATSSFMHGPRNGHAGDWLFTVHQYCGIAATVLAFGFWIVLATRREGTSTALLFPWFRSRGLKSVRDDALGHFQVLMSRKLPAYREDSPLASAVHGLGLLLMTGMGITGSVYFVGLYLNFNLPDSTFFSIDLEIHTLFANLVWAYLIGHALFALIHHYASGSSLRKMWSLVRSK